MNRVSSRKFKPKYIIFIILFILIAFFLKIWIYKMKPTRIIEIPNTVQCNENTDLNYVFVARYYIIVNPPTDPSSLKNLMIDYYKEHKKEIESLEGLNTNLKNAKYKVAFYKESWNFTRNWKPDLTYIDSISEYVLDQIREHYEKRIGYFGFDPNDSDDIYVSIESNGYPLTSYKVPHSELE